MAMKIEIISRETIRPSSPTLDHLKTFKISLLDQLAPPMFVPIVLFYSAEEISSSNVSNIEISSVLKKSLSDTLTRFYPLAGRLDGNDSVDCNDNGVLYVEARADTELPVILRNPEMNILQQFLPLDTNRVRSDKDVPIAAVQVNSFNCGSIAIGVCISHKIADGASLATFLSSWSATSFGATDETITPCLDSALHFPPKEINVMMPSGAISKEKTVTKRFVFDATKLAMLRAKVAGANPTRVEAVTSLIWKSAMAAARENSGKAKTSSILTHVVNIRGKMEPPLPEHSLGNLWHIAISPLVEDEGNVNLHDLVGSLRHTIRKINGDYTKKLQCGNGLAKTGESIKEIYELVGKGEAEFYRFSSWSRFPFYETDFGFGKPTWVCTTNVPIKNVVILMGMRSGNGIEAWVTMTEHDMANFECNHELLEFTSLTPSF